MAEIVPGNALEGGPDEEEVVEVVVGHPDQDDDGPLIRHRGRRRRRRLCPRPRGVQRRSRGYAGRTWVKAAARAGGGAVDQVTEAAGDGGGGGGGGFASLDGNCGWGAVGWGRRSRFWLGKSFFLFLF